MQVEYLTFDKRERPYSQAVRAGGLVYTSGALLPNGANDIEAQTTQLFDDLSHVLKQAGTDLGHVIKVNVYMADLDDRDGFNRVWDRYFPVNKPARTMVGHAGLPGAAKVEIDTVAVLP